MDRRNTVKKKELYISFSICIVIFCLILLFFINRKQTICTNSSDQSKNGYKLDTKYVIKSNWNKVKTVKVTETISYKDKKLLDKFKKQLEKQYSYNKKTYGGYTYKIETNNNQIIGEITIDYKEFDLEYFIENNEAMKEYTKNNKLTLDGAKKMYEATGAVCK